MVYAENKCVYFVCLLCMYCVHCVHYTCVLCVYCVLLPLCCLRGPVGRHALGAAVHLRADGLLAAKSNREFLFGGVYPDTGGVSGKVEQKV